MARVVFQRGLWRGHVPLLPDAKRDVARRVPHAHPHIVYEPVVESEAGAAVLTRAEARDRVDATHDLTTRRQRSGGAAVSANDIPNRAGSLVSPRDAEAPSAEPGVVVS